MDGDTLSFIRGFHKRLTFSPHYVYLGKSSFQSDYWVKYAQNTIFREICDGSSTYCILFVGTWCRAYGWSRRYLPLSMDKKRWESHVAFGGTCLLEYFSCDLYCGVTPRSLSSISNNLHCRQLRGSPWNKLLRTS